MSLWSCVACSTQYAVGLDACPHCGSAEHVEPNAGPVPAFVSLSCDGCGKGPWTVRLNFRQPGLVEIPTLFCASCGHQVQITWSKEDNMPKITLAGVTNALDADPSPDADESPALVAAEGDQGPLSDEEPEAAESEDGPELDEVQDETDEELGVETVAYDGLTLAELKEAAEAKGLPTYGTKAQLIERLNSAE